MSTKKYRPYFTLPELEHISFVLKLNGSVTDRAICRYLDKYILDIKYGVREANHTLQPTIEEKLELNTPTVIVKENSPEHLYYKWQNNQLLTVAELDIVLRYKYENDLMSPEEETAYEKSQGLVL